MTYAVARALSPSTGAPSLDAAGRWRRADSPALEMVQLALRTQRGACPVDPELGIDWQRVDTLRTSAPADATTVLFAGLDRLVRAGLIAKLTVDVRVRAGLGRLSYTVTFLDVLLATMQTAQGVR